MSHPLLPLSVDVDWRMRCTSSLSHGQCSHVALSSDDVTCRTYPMRRHSRLQRFDLAEHPFSTVGVTPYSRADPLLTFSLFKVLGVTSLGFPSPHALSTRPLCSGQRLALQGIYPMSPWMSSESSSTLPEVFHLVWLFPATSQMISQWRSHGAEW